MPARFDTARRNDFATRTIRPRVAPVTGSVLQNELPVPSKFRRYNAARKTSFMLGTKLAHYEITSHLGTGGMGEVYQASDAKLGRNVASKMRTSESGTCFRT